MFVRDLIAIDGSDAGELVLIDSDGCPTDAAILGPLIKSNDNSNQSLETSFEAFKFPASDTVQFKALVTPCVSYCEPASCPNPSGKGPVSSFGRRKRRFVDDKEENVIVVKTLTIEDNFEYKNNAQNNKRSKSAAGKRKDIIRGPRPAFDEVSFDADEMSPCLNLNTIVLLTCVLLFVQMLIVIVWVYLKYLKSRDGDFIIETSRRHRDAFTNGHASHAASLDTLCTNYDAPRAPGAQFKY